MFLLHGGIPILLNIRSCTVVLDCIEQICTHLGITNKLEQHEFAIYYVVEAGIGLFKEISRHNKIEGKLKI